MNESWLQDAGTASRWFFRSLKKGDWVWLVVAVIIASLTVTLVKQLGESVQQSMLRKAAESLGADLVIRSSRPLDPQWQQRAQAQGLQTAQTISLVTMALSGEQFQLVQLKAVPEHYPLRGRIQATAELAFKPLDSQQAWVEPRLLNLMGLNAQSTLTLGERPFTLAGSVRNPQGFSPMSGFAPLVLIQTDELEATGLLGPGSRARYELQLAGEAKQIERFAQQLRKQDNPHWQILSAQSPGEDLEKSLNTAWLFLDLSALSAVLVAGLSILIASRFYLNRWRSSMALMRAMGASNRQMQRLFAMQLSWIAVFSSLIGVGLGYGLSVGLQPLLAQYFDPLVIASPWTAMLTGFISGLLVLWSFAWQAFQNAVGTAPMHILKAVPQSPDTLHWLISFALLLGLITLMLGIDSLLWILAGLVVISLALLLTAHLLLKAMGILQVRSRGWLRIALSNLLKEPGLVKIQLVSVGMVLFVLMLMTFIRQDMLQNWQATLPENTPNTFVMNVQPDQLETTNHILAQFNLHPEMVPMARGRLTAINEIPLRASEQTEDRARRLLERESNLAFLNAIPAHNEVVARLPTDRTKANPLPWVSVESGMAELFNIHPGDRLSFNISGQTVTYQVNSLRSVEWQSFQLNFFFILQPQNESDIPVSYIGNFYLGGDNGETERLTRNLAEQVPGVLLIDVRQIMQQIQEIMSQASWAVSGLYGFTLLASLGVLFTATLASQQGRVQSWLLLRTLGATNREIYQIGLTEFLLLGGLAGLLAASFAQLSGVLISHFLLKTEAQVEPQLWGLSVISGMGLLLLIGLLTQHRFLRKSPQQLKLYLNHHG
ncbi:ABC transporter permease [Thiomicrorhabdus sp. zzn3]|uniref:ABC transporter permease n=1 Tax=Thiomicrorhabdus sp. zzn3 TaxID=3039775 RepID=UPI002437460F|nr:FtsX-like permease family protein [Thiomicrorhabdus sp. zzn3]MDG6778402.1 ABC transporter permease [Thiomicrorhabdus sp. zzn3]